MNKKDILFECKNVEEVKEFFIPIKYSNNYSERILQVYKQYEKGNLSWEKGMKLISEKSLVRVTEMSVIRTIAQDIGHHGKDSTEEGNSWLELLIDNVKVNYTVDVLNAEDKTSDYSFLDYIEDLVANKKRKSAQKDYKKLVIDKNLKYEFWDLVKQISAQLSKAK